MVSSRLRAIKKRAPKAESPSKDIEAKYGLRYEEPIIRSLITNLGREEAWKRLEYCAAHPQGMFNRP